MKDMFRVLLVGVCLMTGVSGFLWAQIKLHTNGKTSFGPIPSQMPSELVLMDAGRDMALKLNVSQSVNWYQSSSASVSRQLTVSWAIRYNGADRFFVLGNGDIYARSAWFYSDSTLKHKIAAIESPLQRIRQLRGVSFYYKPEVPCKDCDPANDDLPSSRMQFGVIAQEIEQVFPEMVTENNEKIKLVAYEQLIPVLIEAVKEQQKQMDAMQKEITLLKEGRK